MHAALPGFGCGSRGGPPFSPVGGPSGYGRVTGADLTPVGDYLTSWRAGELAPLSMTQYRSILKNPHLRHGTRRPTTRKGSAGSRPRAHALELERKGLAASTRHTVQAVLWFADALEDDLIAVDPTIRKPGRQASTAARPRPRFMVWTRDELLALLAAVTDDRLEALWRVAVATGARRGELLALRGSATQQRRARSTSRSRLCRREAARRSQSARRKAHTGGSLDEGTAAALEEHRQREVAERETAGDAYVGRDLIFADELGGLINPQRLTDAFRGHRETAGIRPGRLHDVRHSSASHLLCSGVRCRGRAARPLEPRRDPDHVLAHPAALG
jgi:integrase